MKIFWQVVVGVVVALGVAFFMADRPKWKEYTYEKSGFAVEFPFSVKTSSDFQRMGDTASVTMTMWESQNFSMFTPPAQFYSVTVGEYSSWTPGDIDFDYEKGMRGARDGLLKSVNGTLLSEEDQDLYGVQGREFVVDTVDGKRLTVRVFRDGNKMYQVTVGHLKNKDITERKQHFFDSFQLLDVGEQENY